MGELPEDSDQGTWKLINERLAQLEHADDAAPHIGEIAALAATLDQPADRRRVARSVARRMDWDSSRRGQFARLIAETRAMQYTDRPGRDERGDTRYAIHCKALGEWRTVKTGRGESATEDPVWTTFASFWAKIAAKLTDEEDNSIYVIAGGNAYGQFEVEIPTVDYGITQKLAAALTAVDGNIIYPGFKDHIGPAITDVSDIDLLVRERTYVRTGWADHDGTRVFLIPGMVPSEVRIELPAKLCYIIEPTADPVRGLQAMSDLAKWLGERAMLLIPYLLAGPAAQALGLKNERFVLAIVGETGCYKTTTCQTAMAVYGPGFVDDGNLIKLGSEFGSTPRSISSMASRVRDMPVLIDNFKPQTLPPEKLLGLIHTFLEGGERDRLTSQGRLIEGRPMSCWPVITGEDFLTGAVSDGLDGSTVARTVILSMDGANEEPTTLLTAAQSNAAHLNAVGRTWIEWLAGDGQAVAAEEGWRFQARRDGIVERLRAAVPHGANLLRHASNLAVLESVWSLALTHPDIGPVLSEFDHVWRRALAKQIRSHAAAAGGAQYGYRYLEALRGRIDAGKFIIAGSATEYQDHRNDRDVVSTGSQIVGWRGTIDGVEVIHLLPELAVKPLRQDLDGGSNTLIYRALKRIGALAKSGTADTTVACRFGRDKSDVARVLVLYASCVDRSPDSEDEVPFDAQSLRP